MEHLLPLYMQIRESIRQNINSGIYVAGEKIPSERELAKLYKVNRMTAKKAINSLVDEGILYRIHGSGTYVVDNSKKLLLGNSQNLKNQGISAISKGTGMNIESEVLYSGILKNSRYINYKLKLCDLDEVLALHRIRIADDERIAVEFTSIPKKYFEDFNKINFEKLSLYDYMNSKGHLPIKFSQRLIVLKANSRIADLLDIEEGSGLYYFEYIGLDNKGIVVEHTKSYMRPDKVKTRYEEVF